MTGAARYDMDAILRPADMLVIVPPFAWPDRPSLGVHLLQAIAKRAGLDMQVLYANMLFAAYFDERTFRSLSRTQYSLFLGERLFARAAYGIPALGHDNGAAIDPMFVKLRAEFAAQGQTFSATRESLLRVESRVTSWLDTWVPAIAKRQYKVVGATTSFEQTSVSLAVLGAIKRISPQTITILGGANCEGEMAEGLLELDAMIGRRADFIFSGESEATFAAFVDGLARGELPKERIQFGTPCADLDALPTPNYADYYDQMAAILPEAKSLREQSRVNYETSRGCWWGAKKHCTFCGLNGQGMASRAKSPDRVISELTELLASHPNRQVTLTDNIMPHEYFRTLLPRLAKEVPGLHMMYELKANLTLSQLRALMAAGVKEAQPGIEALSTGLLAHMSKGTTCAQNIALLRYARIVGMRLYWNLLAGFPGDRLAFYEETHALLPLIQHLPPPYRLNTVVIDRFSPYHARAEELGVRDLRPIPPYFEWAPKNAPHSKIAYHFDATFESESLAQRELLEAIEMQVKDWRARWIVSVPRLVIQPMNGRWELLDTRGLPGLPAHQIIDEERAVSALVGRSLSAPERPGDAWAREHLLVVERDRRLIPLALTHVDVLEQLEARHAGRDRSLALAI